MSFGYNDHQILRNRGDANAHTQYLLIDGTRAMTGDLDMGGNEITNVGLVDGVDVSAHAARHVSGGADQIDGDILHIDYTPSNYTPSTTPPEVTATDELTAHLAGLDNAIGSFSETDTLADVMGRGNTTGGVDLVMSSGDDLRAAVAGGSDLGPVGNEFGTLRLVDDAIVGGDLSATNADILTTVRVGNFTGSPAINLDKDDAGRVDIRFRNDTGVGGSWFSVVYNSSEDMIVNRLSNAGGFLDSVLALRSAGNIDVDLAGHGVDFGGNVVVDGAASIAGGDVASANANFDDLVIGTPGGAYGITIDSRSNSGGGYGFRGTSATRDGAVQYDDASRTMHLVAANSIRVGLSSTALYSQTPGAMTVGTVGNPFSIGYLSGRLQVDKVGTGSWLDLSRSGDYVVDRNFYDAGVLRWIERFQNATNNDAIQLRRHDAAGAFVDIPWQARGDTGDIMLSGRLHGSSAGVSGWNGAADDHVWGTGAASSMGTTLWPTDTGTATWAVRNSGNNLHAFHRYSLANERWETRVDGTNVLEWYDNRVAALVEFSLGTTANPIHDMHADGSIVAQKGDLDAQFVLDMFSNGVRHWTLHHQTNEHLAFDRYNASTGVFEGRQLNLNRAGDVSVEARGIFGGMVIAAGAPTSGHPTDTGVFSGDGSGNNYFSSYVSATGAGGIIVGDSVDNDDGRALYNMANTQWQFWVGGSQEYVMGAARFASLNNLDSGSSSLPWSSMFLSDTLAFTGTGGVISVNGTDEVNITSFTTRPATNGGQALGDSTSGWSQLTLASQGSPPGATASRARFWSDSTDNDFAKVQYGSGQIRRLDIGHAWRGWLELPDPVETAVNFTDISLLLKASLFADSANGSRVTFHVPYAEAKCKLHVWALDAANDSFGTITARLYEDNTTSAADTDSINFNSVANPRTFEFTHTLEDVHAYGITLQPGSVDSSNLICELEIIPA